MEGSYLYFLGLFALIGLSAFFSGSEAALFSLRRAQISTMQERSPAGRQVGRLLQKPRDILISILIGNLIVNVSSTSAATAVAVGIFGDKGVAIAFAVMSVLIMIFGEILPKAVAIQRPREFSLASIYPLAIFHTIFTLVRIPIGHLTDAVIESLKKRLGHSRAHFSTEELLTAIDIGHGDGHVGEFEHRLLSGIIEYRETVVREIMTPSISVVSLPLDTPRDELIEKFLDGGFSRVLIYGETADDIRGVLHIKDLVGFEAEDSQTHIEKALREPYYVPESMRISELFEQLGRRRTPLAAVIDEYGSFVGIVTMEDILEELVGEIRDANEPMTASYTVLDKRRIVVLGTVEIDDFNEVFDASIVDEDHETIAGYLTGVVGKIPSAGETFEVDGLRFHIIAADPNRIRKMRVEKT